MDKPSQRLELFIKNNGLTISEVGKSIGMSYANFKKYLGSGKSTLGAKYHQTLQDMYNLNIAWYLTGTGDMFFSKAQVINNQSFDLQEQMNRVIEENTILKNEVIDLRSSISKMERYIIVLEAKLEQANEMLKISLGDTHREGELHPFAQSVVERQPITL